VASDVSQDYSFINPEKHITKHINPFAFCASNFTQDIGMISGGGGFKYSKQ